MRSLLFIRHLSKRCAVAHPVVRPVNARCSRLTLVQYPWHALYPRQRLSTSSQCINTEECGGCDGNECLCWRCGSCVNKAALFCGSCHYIQHVKDTANYFDLLGMYVASATICSLLQFFFVRLHFLSLHSSYLSPAGLMCTISI